MVTRLVELLNFLGMPRVAAVALAVLLSESKALSLTELSRKTGYAKSHLSTHLKILAIHGLVVVVRDKKKILYSANRRSVVNMIRNHLDRLRIMIETASKYLGDQEIRPKLSRISHELEKIVGEIEYGSKQ